MLKPHDLRLGNWILDRGTPVQVSMLSIGVTFYSINGVNLDKGTGKVLKVDPNGKTYVSDEDRFSPIPLTGDMLEDIGFFHDRDGVWYPENSLKFNWDLPVYRRGRYFGLQGTGPYTPEFENLHQFQNIHLDFTGKELSYHPSTISEKTE